MTGWLAVAVLFCGMAPGWDDASITDAEPTLEERVRAVQPTPEEDRWRKVAWGTDLLRARREGNRTGKPIFLWIMNGSPLGCT